ncbi:enoyl-CoA hydratase-related protein [Rhodobacteraceae bacterium XHP0102]|nr:enoyl-CoA hydratase-related protein [Rhodobacteraceae bacterium XHP0102]
MNYERILYEIDAGLAVITLNRPDVLNALDTQMRAELTYAIGQAVQDARVVVITGAGRAFCAGQDLGDAGRVADLNLERLLRDEYMPLVSAITDCPIPVIAAVNGVAAGAGASLALICDVVIASEEARFIQAFVQLGLMPDAGATWVLPRLIGNARAMAAALFGEAITAPEAVEMGLIWKSVPASQFEAEWRSRATTLAQGPSLAYGKIKSALRAAATQGLEAQMMQEAAAQGALGRSRDFKEGVLAFNDKRKPKFEGR